MSIGLNIKKIRKKRGLLQKQVALEVEVDISNYNKMESGKRDPSVVVLKRLAELFGVTTDYLIKPDDELPEEVVIEDKTANEQLNLISQLNDDDKSVIFKMIDTMLTKQKFQNFFQENINK